MTTNDHTWELLMARLDAFDKKQDQILVQVMQTNGRVGRLERWRAWLTGAIGVLIPIVGYLAYQVVEVLGKK